VITALGVALTVVFATASAGSLVDSFQHELSFAHSHKHLSFSDVACNDHHAHADQLHGDEAAQSSLDDMPPADMSGIGHHHHCGDGPVGFVALGSSAEASLSAHGAELSAGDSQVKLGSLVGGLERPPKHLTTSV
jgi:hypothetical protein